MKKRVLLIIACMMLLCIAVGLCLYAIPHNTKIRESMQATKLDKDGNTTGTDTIILQGSFNNYLLKEDTLELTINPFGTLKSIVMADTGSGNTFTVPVAFDDFYTFTFLAWDTSKEDSVFCTVTVSQDFEYWVFRVGDNDQPIYYVASASNEHTVEEIVQYFKGIAPGYKAP